MWVTPKFDPKAPRNIGLFSAITWSYAPDGSGGQELADHWEPDAVSYMDRLLTVMPPLGSSNGGGLVMGSEIRNSIGSQPLLPEDLAALLCAVAWS